MTSIVEIIRHASIISVALPLLSYLILVSLIGLKNTPNYIHIVFLLLLFLMSLDIYLAWLVSINQNVILPINLGILIQFIIITLYYYNVQFKDKSKRNYIAAAAVFFLFFLINTSVLQQLKSGFQSYTWGFSAVIILYLGIIHYKTLLVIVPGFGASKDLMEKHSSLMWINGAFLYYFGLNIWLFFMLEYLFKNFDSSTLNKIWVFHNVNNIIKNVFLAIGIYQAKKVMEGKFFDYMRERTARNV